MKVILCTGDSHTCGQWAEGFGIDDDVELGYNVAGKGFGRNASFESTCYVNLIRDFIVENTHSRVENVDISIFGRECARSRFISTPVALQCNCDLMLFKVAERKEPAAFDIYLDGEICRNVTLCAEITRYGDWSFRYIPVFCGGKNKIEIVPVQGEIYITSLERWTGEYAVVNCGVGSCDTTRYIKEYMPELIEEFSPYAFLAEAHTINDWLSGKTVEEYGNELSVLLKLMKSNSHITVMTTVSPVLGEQCKEQTAAPYEEFVKESERIICDEDVIFADGHNAIKEKCEGLSEEELRCTLFSDNWHVNQAGHDIYAKVFIEKLKEVLLLQN